MSSDWSIKCLLIGQAGVGKTTFLSKFPNAKMKATNSDDDENSQKSKWKETYIIEYMSTHFETRRIEMDVCDVSLETCLRSSSDMSRSVTADFTTSRGDTSSSQNRMSTTTSFIPLLPVPSSKFIDVDPYKIIVLTFAMDDPHSFEIIKSKWEVDLKKNRSQQHSFILIGFKSDLVLTSKNATDNEMVGEN